MIFARKDRVLGRAEKRSYDIPLNNSPGTNFLVILIGLMTFLGFMALTATFALSAMDHRWTSGLENRVTIEIPAQDSSGKLLDRKTIAIMTGNTAAALGSLPGIVSVHPLSDAEIGKLIEPWLGQDLDKTDIPVPGIIALQTETESAGLLQAIHDRIDSIAPAARIDTHEEWLNDLLRFTGALKLGALILSLVIGVTVATAVSGGVQARLAIHRAEVEILHLMGASDHYITRQFQRHSVILALRGSLTGAAFAIAALLAIGWVAGRMDVEILPDFHIDGGQKAMLAAIPLAIAAITALTARLTVLRVLASFP